MIVTLLCPKTRLALTIESRVRNPAKSKTMAFPGTPARMRALRMARGSLYFRVALSPETMIIEILPAR